MTFLYSASATGSKPTKSWSQLPGKLGIAKVSVPDDDLSVSLPDEPPAQPATSSSTPPPPSARNPRRDSWPAVGSIWSLLRSSTRALLGFGRRLDADTQLLSH